MSIAMDTNLLVRLLVRDDDLRAARLPRAELLA